MKFETIIVVFCILLVAITLVYAHFSVDNKYGKVYNCDLAEFHPDYPKEVKQKCRELRNDQNRSMQ